MAGDASTYVMNHNMEPARPSGKASDVWILQDVNVIITPLATDGVVGRHIMSGKGIFNKTVKTITTPISSMSVFWYIAFPTRETTTKPIPVHVSRVTYRVLYFRSLKMSELTLLPPEF